MIPLSYAQSRIWFLDRMGERAGYLLPVATRLRGRLDRTALAEAIGDVVARHESLRTIFPENGGVGEQVVLEPAAVHREPEVVEVDEAGLPAALDEAATRLFDLTSEAPLRVTLFRIDDDVHVLLILLHHIAADGWSLTVLLRDLSTAYEARLRRDTPDLPPPPVQYIDYTLWQQSLLTDEEDPAGLAREHWEYWRNKLDGIPDHLALPTDRPRPNTASHRGATATSWVPADVHRGLLALAGEERATPFMVVQTALAALLTVLGSGEDIPIGTVVAGRTDVAMADLIGMCVNTLVLRTDTSGTPTLRELLRRARSTALEAYAYQELPFERLVDLLNPTRSTAWSPLFQVLLVRQDGGALVPDLPGLTATEEPISITTSKFDLSLYFKEHVTAGQGEPDGISFVLEYATELFDPATADRVLDWLGRVLRQTAREPDAPLSDIDLLTEAERYELLVEFNSRTTY